MYRFSYTIALIALTICLGFNDQNSLLACTGIMLTAKDNSFVHGRTLEFGVQLDISLAVIPKNYEFQGSTPLGAGLSYKSKYAVLGAIAFNNPAILDGINEKGLSVGTFYFPGFAKYKEVTKENQKNSLSPTDFPNWIVTQFETVEEVKVALKNVNIVPTLIQNWGNDSPPFHYIVYDKNGKCLVIEPINQELITYDNPLGSFTNSPTFDWHLTNLRNYINLTTLNAKPISFRGLEFSGFGQGSGMVGMPGDFTPPSRFVRASIYTMTAIPSKNHDEAIFQAFHILNQFDIPIGVIKEEASGRIYTDYTLLTCVKDPQSLKFYFKTFEDQTIKMADLKQFDGNAKEIKTIKISGNSPFVDISSNIK